MKAAVYHGPGDFRVEDIPIPQPGSGEMLVRVDVCGVCLTDVKKIQKGLLPGPRVFGHEIAGTVAALGAGVTRFREGDRVMVYHHVPCRSCFYCGVGAYAQCAAYKRTGTTAGFEPAGGGFAEYVKAMPWIVEHGAIAIPQGVAAEAAAFVEPVNTCLKAVRKAGIQSGQTVLVVGQGPIGLILMQLARWAGAEAVGSDPLPDRRAMSERLGARDVLDPGHADVAAEVRAGTSGRGADVAIVAAVGAVPFAQAVAATRPGGRVLVFSATAPGDTAEVDLGALAVSEKDILTSYSSSVDVQDLAAELVFSGRVRVAELITHRFPLRDAAQAVGLAAKPTPGVLKIVVEMGSPA